MAKKLTFAERGVRTYTIEEVRDAIVEEILGYEVEELVDPEVFTAAAIERLKNTPQPQGDASPEVSGGGEWVLTMRSGVADCNDNVIGTFHDYATALTVGGILFDADKMDAPEYRTFDVKPAALTPRAHEPAPTAKARPAWNEMHCQNGMADVCRASQRDGVVCPDESCDIDDGVRPKDEPAPTADGGAVYQYKHPGETGWTDCAPEAFQRFVADPEYSTRTLYLHPAPAPGVARKDDPYEPLFKAVMETAREAMDYVQNSSEVFGARPGEDKLAIVCREFLRTRRPAWRPMDEAPRDGTRFLAKTASGIMRVDFRHPRQDQYMRETDSQFWKERPNDRYVAWQPLPQDRRP